MARSQLITYFFLYDIDDIYARIKSIFKQTTHSKVHAHVLLIIKDIICNKLNYWDAVLLEALRFHKKCFLFVGWLNWLTELTEWNSAELNRDSRIKLARLASAQRSVATTTQHRLHSEVTETLNYNNYLSKIQMKDTYRITDKSLSMFLQKCSPPLKLISQINNKWIFKTGIE